MGDAVTERSEGYELPRSWLVQRLERPQRSHPLLGQDNPFSFGGGLKNGGLSDEAMGLLRSIFSFDYMGAAEFEYGAVPKALTAIAKSAKRYRAFSIDIRLRDVEKHWRDKSESTPSGSVTVYIICHADHAKEVERRIRGWAKGKGDRLKESTMLPSALRPVNDWDSRRCGWLELDNGFFFFTDEPMWRATAELFGVKTPVHSGEPDA